MIGQPREQLLAERGISIPLTCSEISPLLIRPSAFALASRDAGDLS